MSQEFIMKIRIALAKYERVIISENYRTDMQNLWKGK
jgi:hypothetical protein